MSDINYRSKTLTIAKLIGHFAVDSGQFLIVDPAYLGRWTDNEFKDIRRYKHTKTGKVLQYRVGFEMYDQPIMSEEGRTMNDLIKSGEWDRIEWDNGSYGLDYDSACRRTLAKGGGGELGGSMAVACRTAHGDGVFPVYRVEDEHGDLLRVVIDFEGDFEDGL